MDGIYRYLRVHSGFPQSVWNYFVLQPAIKSFMLFCFLVLFLLFLLCLFFCCFGKPAYPIKAGLPNFVIRSDVALVVCNMKRKSCHFNQLLNLSWWIEAFCLVCSPLVAVRVALSFSMVVYCIFNIVLCYVSLIIVHCSVMIVCHEVG